MTQSDDLLSLSVRDFLAAVAAKRPTPGGGSAAAVAGAMGVALGEMALNFTMGKKKYAAHGDFHARAARRLARAHEMFQQLVADDVGAFANYQDASRLADGPRKDEAIQLAVAAAIDVPREAAKLALVVLGDLLELSDKCSRLLVSDLAAAAAMLEAVCRLADYNVRINVPQVADRQAAEGVRQASASDVKRAAELRAEIEQAVREHLP